MYNATTIKTNLIGLVGWRQNVDSNGWQLTDLTASSSGLYFNDVHPLLTIDNLISVAPEFDVLHDGDNAARDAAFTAWLKERTESGILKAIESWLDEKSDLSTARNLLSRTDLFDVTGNVTDLELSSGKAVGIEIVPAKSKSLTANIEKIGIQLDTNQTLDVHLFKSGKVIPDQTVSIVYAGSGAVQWETVNWSLDGEGAYYVAYDQQLISGNAINGVRDYTYDNAGRTSFPTGRYFGATAFNAGIADLSALWDLSKNAYTVSTNYGINLSMNVQCDYTSFVVDQKNLFKSVIFYEVGISLLNELLFNPNSKVNRNESNISDAKLLHSIEGDTQGRNNLSVGARYEKALKAIQFDTSEIDKICLPCRRRRIRHTSVGPSSSYRLRY